MRLSFICPCYNEEDNIFPLVKAIKDEFPVTDEYEIVFVNDGSQDNTLNKMLDAKAVSGCNIKIVDFSRNFGKESAMYAGLEHSSGDIITIIDADLQQNPSVVSKMIYILDSSRDVDCVCAYQENRSENKFYSACKNLFYKIADKTTEIEFKNGASDFRTFRKCVKDAILSMPEYHRFSKGIFSWVGFNTVYIPYQADERKNGKSSFSFFSLLKYGINGIINFSTLPIKFASLVGGSAIVFSIIYAIITIIRKLVNNINVDGFTQLVILITFFGGIQLFSVGIIGEYIAKNYIQSKKRPIYIARNIIDYK